MLIERACICSATRLMKSRGTKIKDLIHPEDLEIVPYTFQELLVGEFGRVDRRIRKKDGSYVTMEIIDTRIEENLFQGIYRDISERIQMQNLLRKRAEELAESNEQLLRSNQDLQDFAYVASHDLQEPLRNVASCLQMLEKGYKQARCGCGPVYQLCGGVFHTNEGPHSGFTGIFPCGNERKAAWTGKL